MKRKVCFRCGGEKALVEFYAHPGMADGHLNKCIECAKKDVRKNYAMTREARRVYEQGRARDPERRAKRVEYLRALKKRSPLRATAWSKVGAALRSGKLVRQPCERCGTSERIQAHHEDYSKPLDVMWLCFACHRKHHGQTVLEAS